jgi:hypothetical protein
MRQRVVRTHDAENDQHLAKHGSGELIQTTSVEAVSRRGHGPAAADALIKRMISNGHRGKGGRHVFGFDSNETHPSSRTHKEASTDDSRT